MAERAYLGGAIPIRQKDTITLGGTFAATETITLTLNNKDLVLTIGTTVDIPTVLDNLIVMLTGSGTFGASYSSNALGSTVGEFKLLTWEDEGATIINVTGAEDGRPFTLTEATSSGAGTVVQATTQSPTGPHHFDNQDNWTGNTVPVDNDDIIFDQRMAKDLKYAIDQNGVTPASITIYTGSKNIGLDPVNTTDPTYPFDEDLETFLKLGNSGDAVNTTIDINTTTSRRINLDSGTGQVTMIVNNTSISRLNSNLPVLRWLGTHASNDVTINKGDVGVAVLEGEAATISTLRVNYVDNKTADVTLDMGDGVTLTTVDQNGGDVTVRSNSTTTTVTGGTLTCLEGTVTTLSVHDGACRYNSTGTITTLTVGVKGDFDRTGDSRSLTITNTVQLHAGAKFKDPHSSITYSGSPDFTLNGGAKFSDVELDIGVGRGLTLT